MKNAKLDSLVDSGDISSYEYTKEWDEPGKDKRTTEKLCITFPNGYTLTLDTFCSGSMENTHLEIY